MVRNWYNQIPHPALKTRREITKYINWQQFMKGAHGKSNEQLFPRQVETGPDSSIGRVSAPGNGRSRVRSRAATYQSRKKWY